MSSQNIEYLKEARNLTTKGNLKSAIIITINVLLDIQRTIDKRKKKK